MSTEEGPTGVDYNVPTPGLNGPAGQSSVIRQPVVSSNVFNSGALSSNSVMNFLMKLANGAVLRWSSKFSASGGGTTFTYLALKAQDKWYTTATDANTRVGQILTDGELATVLLQPEVIDIESPSSWHRLQ